MITLLLRWLRDRSGKPGVVIRTYKGDKAAERGIAKMTGQYGYEVQNHTTRKAMYSAAAGIFTRKQIHTVTFVRE